MAESKQLIGSRISLISHKNVRYDGTLFLINQEQSSVTLKDVKCLGTEDRPPVKGPELKPDGKVWDYVVFSASDIKDLHVHEADSQDAPKPPSKQKEDEQVRPPAAPKNEAKVGGGNNEEHGLRPARGRGGGRAYGGRRNNDGGRGSAGMPPGMGAHLMSRRGKLGAGGGDAPEDAKGEFDFEGALQGFDKEAEFSKLNLNGATNGAVPNDEDSGAAKQDNAKAAIPPVKKYNKSSFFDDLTAGPGMERPTLADERRTNMDTFGVAALQGPYRRYGGRGGRGYRGRGRGGYRGGSGRGRSDYGRGRIGSRPATGKVNA